MSAAAAQTAALLKDMSMTIAAMAAEMDEMRREIKRMQKLLPVQVTEINQLVRDRTRELLEEYRLPAEAEKSVNARIRAAVKAQFGGTVKECAREDYDLIKQFVGLWEDSPVLRRMRR